MRLYLHGRENPIYSQLTALSVNCTVYLLIMSDVCN